MPTPICGNTHVVPLWPYLSTTWYTEVLFTLPNFNSSKLWWMISKSCFFPRQSVLAGNHISCMVDTFGPFPPRPKGLQANRGSFDTSPNLSLSLRRQLKILFPKIYLRGGHILWWHSVKWLFLLLLLLLSSSSSSSLLLLLLLLFQEVGHLQNLLDFTYRSLVTSERPGRDGFVAVMQNSWNVNNGR